MRLEGEVGIHVGYDGVDNPIRLTRMGGVVTSDGHGRYTEPTFRGGVGLSIGGVYSTANSVAVTATTGLSQTVATLSLSNDYGNSKALALLSAGWAFSAPPAAASVIYLVGNYIASSGVIHTTPATVRNNYLGGAIGSGKADTAATLPIAPTVITPLTSVTAASSITPAPAFIDLGGQIILPPGAFVAIQASTTATGFGSFSWEEIPI